MKSFRVFVAIALTGIVLRLAPIPRQVETLQGTMVVPGVTWRADYAKEDGSFMLFIAAGCLPWKSCAINEPTDWWIGGH